MNVVLGVVASPTSQAEASSTATDAGTEVDLGKIVDPEAALRLLQVTTNVSGAELLIVRADSEDTSPDPDGAVAQMISCAETAVVWAEALLPLLAADASLLILGPPQPSEDADAAWAAGVRLARRTLEARAKLLMAKRAPPSPQIKVFLPEGPRVNVRQLLAAVP